MAVQTVAFRHLRIWTVVVGQLPTVGLALKRGPWVIVGGRERKTRELGRLRAPPALVDFNTRWIGLTCSYASRTRVMEILSPSSHTFFFKLIRTVFFRSLSWKSKICVYFIITVGLLGGGAAVVTAVRSIMKLKPCYWSYISPATYE